MKKLMLVSLIAFLVAFIYVLSFELVTTFAADSAPDVKLAVFGAGTPAVPFKQIDREFMKKYPNVTVQSQFGGAPNRFGARIVNIEARGTVLKIHPDYGFHLSAI